MPTDQVLNRTFEELFSGAVRYEIPFFQRGYAWEARQWKKLLEDVRNEVLDNVVNEQFEDEEHFFGPIVVLEKLSGHPSLKRFLVIDGQQRITTIYLLLAVIREQLDAKQHLSADAAHYSATLEALLRNPVAGADDYLRLKVVSTKGDRFPTYKAVFGTNPSSPFLAEDQLLYRPEENRVDAFVKFARRELRGYDVPRLWQLSQALLKSLKIVWIPLNAQKDDPQAIFESLNDAGMPLSASELLCNYLFRPLADDTTNQHEQLHNERWLKARHQVGEANFEAYLRTLLSIGENKWVGKDRRLYVHFKVKNRRLTAAEATATLDRILAYTNVYNQVTQPVRHPHPLPAVRRLLIAVHDTNMSSVNPFLMAVLKAQEHQALSEDDTLALLRETYVLLVRRKVTGLPTTKYDTFFPGLLERLVREPNKLRAFQTLVQREGLWVADQDFEDAFLTKAIYNQRELNFSRLVLQEIDRAMQQHGELPDYSTVNTVEHVLPQTLSADWRLDLGAEADDPRLPVLTHTLGNLCLNSRPANSTFGQARFLDKQAMYTDVCALVRDVKTRPAPWNLDAIRQRSRDLAVHALHIWRWMPVSLN